jgi:ATP/maltotriose-dependent transcriptional regulator MalT
MSPKHERSTERAENPGERQLEAARTAWRDHRYEAALEHAAAAQEAFAASSDRRAAKEAQYMAGRIALSCGRQEDARAWLAAALAFFKRAEDTYWAALAQGALTELDTLQRPAAARAEMEQVVATLREFDDDTALVEQLTRLGRAAAADRSWPAAVAAFTDAAALSAALDQPAAGAPALAGLAAVAFASGRMATARNQVDELIPLLSGNHAGQIPDLFGVYLTAIRILQSVGDPRAQDLLQTAQQRLEARAATIADPALRHDFLEHIPAHQALIPPDLSELRR